MKHIFSIIIILLIIVKSSLAQDFTQNFQPYSTTSEKSLVLTSINFRYAKDLKRLPSKHGKEIKKVYEERYEYLVEQIENGHYIEDETVSLYFQNILQHIIESNPKLKHREVRLLISRSSAPNASCIGEGTLVLNIGLINRLENESQLAFVICHELAHYTRNHVNRSIIKSVNVLHSKKTQKELSKISKLKYNRTDRATQLLKTIAYDKRRHGREHEEEADSIGLSFLKNTKYDVNEAVSLLKVLDKIDEEKYKNGVNFKKWFNHPDYPFRDRWLEKEDFIQMKVADEDEDFSSDSLKTHPDCSKRIQSLGRQLKDFSNPEQSVFIQNKQWLNDFITATDFEMIQRNYDYGNLALSFYYTLQLLEKYPENVYLYNMIGQCFESYREARLIHEGSLYVPIASNTSESNYNQMLLFLNNLRTRELSKVAYYFMNQHKDKFMSDKSFLYTYMKHTKMLKKEDEAKALLEIYNKKE